jgi:hypothetical protein
MLAAVPILILNLDESAVADCRYSVGLLLAIVWALAERSRLLELASQSKVVQGAAPQLASVVGGL